MCSDREPVYHDPEFREVQTMETYPLNFVREDLLESSDERAIDDMLGHGTDSTTPVYEIRIKFKWNRQTRAAGTRQGVMHGFILKKMNVRGPQDR